MSNIPDLRKVLGGDGHLHQQGKPSSQVCMMQKALGGKKGFAPPKLYWYQDTEIVTELLCLRWVLTPLLLDNI